jgi:DNA-binding NtrC family response regulator
MVDETEKKEDTLSVMPIYEMEKKLIFKALQATNGNRTKAAEILGITVRTLRNKLKEYGKTGNTDCAD